jgi:predicted nucleic acid-binding protein
VPLYKFRTDYDGVISEDDVGEVFSTLVEAVAHASVVATELSRNNTRSTAVSVVDETGTIVAKGRDLTTEYKLRSV